jgi:hypothetical protein
MEDCARPHIGGGVIQFSRKDVPASLGKGTTLVVPIQTASTPGFSPRGVAFFLNLNLLGDYIVAHFFTRTCTRVPSGRVPFESSTVPLRTTPSNSCEGWFEDRVVEAAT